MNRLTLNTLLGLAFIIFSDVAMATELDSIISEINIHFSESRKAGSSSTTKRRSFKKVIREGKKYLEQNAFTDKHYDLYYLIFKAQIRLLSLDDSSRLPQELEKTCQKLSEAPNTHAHLRLEPDFYLFKLDQHDKHVDMKTREDDLLRLVEKYTGTSGELKSLLLGLKFGENIGSTELLNSLRLRLSQRFPGNPSAIAFLKSQSFESKVDILFRGTLTDIDGKKLVFPTDLIGQSYMVVFWSQNSPSLEQKFQQLKEQQENNPDALKVFSINLDNLSDGGSSFISKSGVNAKILFISEQLKESYKATLIMDDPFALRVNEVGYAPLPSKMLLENFKLNGSKTFSHHEKIPKSIDVFGFPAGVESDRRYGQQISSLSIGDFLVEEDETHIKGELSLRQREIQSLFTPTPYRYRLSRTEALKRYEQANNLCVKALAGIESTDSLNWTRSRRVIALLGLWNLTLNQKYFTQACNDSDILLHHDAKGRERLIALFCLAKKQLRNGILPQTVLETFVTDSKLDVNTSDPYASAVYASASVLAIHTGLKHLHDQYRTAFLREHEREPLTLSVAPFLLDRYHQYYLFRPNPDHHIYSRMYRFVERRYMIDNDIHRPHSKMPDIQLQKLDGSTLNLASDLSSDYLNLQLYLEPPAEGHELPNSMVTHTVIETKFKNKGKKKIRVEQKKVVKGLLETVFDLAKLYNSKHLRLTTIFISDQPKQVSEIVSKYNIPGTIALAPKGYRNSGIKKLGLISADRVPSIVLLDRDNSIIWRHNGLSYRELLSMTNIRALSLKHHISAGLLRAGKEKLELGEYLHALAYSTRPNESDVKKPNQLHKWSASRYFGRSLTHGKIKKWEQALEDIDRAIREHQTYFNHSQSEPCSSMIHFHHHRSVVLKELGRVTESKMGRAQALLTPTEYPTLYTQVRGHDEPYQHFDEELFSSAYGEVTH